MAFADVYPLYLKKIMKKGRSEAELIKVITWLTGLTPKQINMHISKKTTFREFFKECRLNSNSKLITGTICGVRIEAIEEPLMKKIRYLDKLVDELAKGRPLEKILRSKSTM